MIEELSYSEDNQKIPHCLNSIPTEYYEQIKNYHTNIQETATNLFRLDSKQFKKYDKILYNESKMTRIHKRTDKPLKKLIKKFKVQKLVQNFCNKIKRNITSTKPILDNQFSQSHKHPVIDWIINTEGYNMPSGQLIIFTLINICLIIILTVFYSLSIVFPQIQQNQFIKNAQVFAFCFYTIQMIFNFITKHYQDGKSLVFLNQIALSYFKQKFLIDLLSLLGLVIDNINQNQTLKFTKYWRLIIIVKLFQNLEKLQTFQNIFITNFYKEQYWGLVAVILTNFCFAHILSILLNAMASLDSSNNWLISHHLQNRPWYQKYIWGYYWGVTIMLTVGFGDYTATNYQQAICLIFIEMFSCISLAYNINCLGNLMSNLRSKTEQKNKYLKTFNLMSKSNQISYSLQKRINNFIQGSFLIKKDFNFQQQDQVINFLPKSLKNQYLIQANKKIFRDLIILKNFTEKTRNMLAQNVIKMIAHPQQIIQKKGEIANLLILQQGEVGFTITQKKSKKNDKIMQKIRRSQNECHKLISLDFIKNQTTNFNIKSLTYSVLYYFQKQNLINILKQSNYDFQQFCMLRDRQSYLIDQNQIYKCQLCYNQYHNRFKCPKLHFIPIKQLVIKKNLSNQKKIKQLRIKINQHINSQSLQKFRSQISQLSANSKIASGIYQSFNQFQTVTDIQQDKDNHDYQNSKFIKIFMDMMYESKKQKQSFWQVQCDSAFDWKYYFPKFNPENLKNRRKYKNS